MNELPHDLPEEALWEHERRSRILIVEDQPANVFALYGLLSDRYDIVVATDGAQGVAQCRAMLPDLVLLDVQLPAFSGYEVCRRLRQDPLTCAIPIIFLTASADTASEVEGFALGAVDFIAKPIVDVIVRARVNAQLTIKRQRDALRRLLMTDPLTGVGNRRQFDAELARQWSSCQRSATALSLLMIDVDHFKLYNDLYGHQAGDACLVAVAAACRVQFARPLDTFARFGGEEFVAVLPETPAAGAAALAQRVLDAVAALALPHAGSPQASQVSISVGVASMVPGPGLDCAALVAAADGALYQAKRAGRNRVGVLAGLEGE